MKAGAAALLAMRSSRPSLAGLGNSANSRQSLAAPQHGRARQSIAPDMNKDARNSRGMSLGGSLGNSISR